MDIKNCKVTIYIPATIGIDKLIDNSEYVKRAALLLCQCFGGATESQRARYWVSDTAGLVKENTTTISSYCTKQEFDRYIKGISKYCKRLRKIMRQDCIALEISENVGVMHFIK